MQQERNDETASTQMIEPELVDRVEDQNAFTAGSIMSQKYVSMQERALKACVGQFEDALSMEFTIDLIGVYPSLFTVTQTDGEEPCKC
jgi:hypothetical protein